MPPLSVQYWLAAASSGAAVAPVPAGADGDAVAAPAQATRASVRRTPVRMLRAVATVVVIGRLLGTGVPRTPQWRPGHGGTSVACRRRASRRARACRRPSAG